MKRRRTLIVSLLLVAALCMGIGYAAFTSEMEVTGTASMAEIENQVVFTAAVAATGDDSDGATLDTDSTSGLNTKALTLVATGFKDVGDKAVVTVTISNPHDFDVVISNFALATTTDAKNANGVDCITVACDSLDDKVVPAHDAGVDGTLNFDITITCVATSHAAINEVFTITYNVDADTSA